MNTISQKALSRAEQADDSGLIAYYRRIMAAHTATPGTYGNWCSNLLYLNTYVRAMNGTEDVPLADLTREWVESYRRWLISTPILGRAEKEDAPAVYLSRNTTATYFAKLRSCLRSAYRDGLTHRNLAELVESVPMDETERSYLTHAELQRMQAAECRLLGLKRAFLFSCLTGLRRCDIERLTWEQVAEEAGFVRIKFRQKKTRGLEYLDISPLAARLLGPRATARDHVFADFHYSSHALKRLREWATSAGVDKHITFHTSRHTFAVLLLATGSDLYTVQRLLGHRSIETTQIYAHIFDSQKREAVMRISQLLAKSTYSEL